MAVMMEMLDASSSNSSFSSSEDADGPDSMEIAAVRYLVTPFGFSLLRSAGSLAKS